MKKFLKFIPLLIIGIIASIAMVGCGNIEKDASTSAKVKVAAAMPLAMTYSESGEPCEHDFEAINVVAATCTEQGYTVYTCTNCGERYTDNFVPALGHSFSRTFVRRHHRSRDVYAQGICDALLYDLRLRIFGYVRGRKGTYIHGRSCCAHLYGAGIYSAYLFGLRLFVQGQLCGSSRSYLFGSGDRTHLYGGRLYHIHLRDLR